MFLNVRYFSYFIQKFQPFHFFEPLVGGCNFRLHFHFLFFFPYLSFIQFQIGIDIKISTVSKSIGSGIGSCGSVGPGVFGMTSNYSLGDFQPDSQGHLRYPRYGEDPDTGWSRGTQILGARHSYLAGVGKNASRCCNLKACSNEANTIQHC